MKNNSHAVVVEQLLKEASDRGAHIVIIRPRTISP
jgi:hypothetical protein